VSGALRLAGLLGLLLCACHSAAGRLEEANTLRRAGDVKGALGRYKTVLADLGDEPLPADQAAVRWKALKGAAEVSYLELGDYEGAVAYYRRIISLYPNSQESRDARIAIGDIYRERFQDNLAAIAQYAEVAGSNAPEAPRYQLEVAKAYLELKNYSQARTEARILGERWPRHELAADAQLLAAQAWTLEKRDAEALSAYQALIDRRPRPDVLARALVGQAHIYAQAGRFSQALDLYQKALPYHPNPDAIRVDIDAVRERQAKAQPATPGDHDAAFDHDKRRAAAPAAEP
jgi:tetratricopeptide (TPR) repeat protein